MHAGVLLVGCDINPQRGGIVATCPKSEDLMDLQLRSFPVSNNTSLQVTEGLPSGTVIGTLAAKDPDEGENGTIYYSLSGEPHNSSYSHKFTDFSTCHGIHITYIVNVCFIYFRLQSRAFLHQSNHR